MAKTSKIAKQKQREAVVAKYAEKRQALKDAHDYIGLSQLPRDASPTGCTTVASSPAVPAATSGSLASAASCCAKWR